MLINQLNPLLLCRRLTSYILMGSLAVCFMACKKHSDNVTDSEGALPILGTCKAVTPSGRLIIEKENGPFTYKTSGGGTIKFNPDLSVIITHDSYPGFTLELWGAVELNGRTTTAANHENLNGKHIKDRIGSSRTILFPDGTKMTMVSTGLYSKLSAVTIYDGTNVHHFNLSCSKLEYSALNESVAKTLDESQADGETGSFEISSTGLLFINIYNEDTPGNKVMSRVLLGEIFRDKPNQVNDWFDDPRLQAT